LVFNWLVSFALFVYIVDTAHCFILLSLVNKRVNVRGVLQGNESDSRIWIILYSNCLLLPKQIWLQGFLMGYLVIKHMILFICLIYSNVSKIYDWLGFKAITLRVGLLCQLRCRQSGTNRQSLLPTKPQRFIATKFI